MVLCYELDEQESVGRELREVLVRAGSAEKEGSDGKTKRKRSKTGGEMGRVCVAR